VRDVDALSARQRSRVVARVGLLADFPLMGPAMDGPYAGFRQIVVGRQRVVYLVRDSEVIVHYVRHGARQLILRIVREED
jgi:plasmid stabilization system protein ParE